MKYLIDTHVCLWAVAEKQKLSARIKEILEDPEILIIYNQVSLLEIAIKYQTGKLPDFKITLELFDETLKQKGFTMQPIINDHLSAYFNCNFFSEYHRDPFDRYLLAVADFEQAAIITKDDKFQLYKTRIEIVW